MSEEAEEVGDAAVVVEGGEEAELAAADIENGDGAPAGDADGIGVGISGARFGEGSPPRGADTCPKSS